MENTNKINKDILNSISKGIAREFSNPKKALFVKKIYQDSKMPFRADDGSAGLDLSAHLPFDEEIKEQVSKIVIQPNSEYKIDTGLAFQIPQGYYMEIVPRSSMGIKKNLMFKNTVGIIDSSYRGQVLMFVKNIGNEPIEIEHGERIAQAILHRCENFECIEVKELDKTERGAGGFGSSGKQ